LVSNASAARVDCPSSTWLVVALFLFLIVRTYLGRKDTRTPKWMGRLQTADAGFSFRLGLLLFLPTDIMTVFTVGALPEPTRPPMVPSGSPAALREWRRGGTRSRRREVAGA
jgi:hypothetical protein